MIKDPTTIRTFAPISFVFPAVAKDGDRMSNGILRVISPTANTDINVVHNLGRIPILFMVFGDLDTTANPPGSSFYCPKWKRSIITAWTVKQVTVQLDTT